MVTFNGDVKKGFRLDIVMAPPPACMFSMFVNELSAEFHSRVLHPDEIKKRIMQLDPGCDALTLYVESRLISDRVFLENINSGDNVVLPITIVSVNTKDLLNDYLAEAKASGYTVNVHYLERDDKRSADERWRDYVLEELAQRKSHRTMSFLAMHRKE